MVLVLCKALVDDLEISETMIGSDSADSGFRTPVDQVSYDSDLQGSVWGVEIAEVIDVISACKPYGRWGNICAGDGRYNHLLLNTADQVCAVDLDENALARLIQRSPRQYRKKIVPIIHNLLDGLPFGNSSLDGVLLNGSLHLFLPRDVEKVCLEILRVLRPGGIAITDFWYDIQRVLDDGQFLMYPNEYAYSEAEAIQISTESWGANHISLLTVATPKILVRLGEVSYTYSSRGLVVTVIKNLA
jgi:SAM-dependent methyltransferase